jgi:hypothetical protein
MNRFSPLHCIAVATILFLGAISANPAAQGPSDPLKDLLDRLTFRSIGPATMGGRADDLAVLETHPSVFYAGFATGGLWKTMNNGTTWTPVFDHEDVVSIGAVAIPHDSADLVWVGTGENNNR